MMLILLYDSGARVQELADLTVDTSIVSEIVQEIIILANRSIMLLR